ncbi:MAG: hypothetical protein Kapaf2KO_06670 [Candidatus Kapaibacteriales bacterium]
MLKTKAISPEVKELFETVSKQAELYKGAFARIQDELEKLENERVTLEELRENIDERYQETVSSLSKMLEEHIGEVNRKSERSLNIGNELEELDELRNELTDLRNGLKTGLSTLNEAKDEFEKRGSSAIESAIIDLQDNIGEKLRTEAEKIEVRLSVDSNKSKQRIVDLDSRLRSITDKLSKENRQLAEESTQSTTAIRVIASELQELKDNIGSQLKSQKAEVKETIQEFQKSSKSEGKNSSGQASGEELRKTTNKISKIELQLKKSERKLDNLKNDVSSDSKKLSMSMILSVIAVLCSLAVFGMLIFN